MTSPLSDFLPLTKYYILLSPPISFVMQFYSLRHIQKGQRECLFAFGSDAVPNAFTFKLALMVSFTKQVQHTVFMPLLLEWDE